MQMNEKIKMTQVSMQSRDPMIFDGIFIAAIYKSMKKSKWSQIEALIMDLIQITWIWI